MLGLIRKETRATAKYIALSFLAAGAFSSCATKQEPQLVSDGRTGEESSLPWNQQAKWEGQGQLGNMAERFNTR